jgi:UDP-glucose 4-epimerase
VSGQRRRRAIVFGGAGFIGHHLVERLVARGDHVAVVDGLLPETGGSRDHVAHVMGAIDFHASRIEELNDLDALLADADVVVDCMAWTRHVAALERVLYDAQLNLESHLTLLTALRRRPGPLVVYLGSSSQYGRVTSGPITEQTPMVPEDVQGIHKAAADHHFRVHAALHGLNVVSLRLPNCFGEGQPIVGGDIGLVGGFIRALLAGEAVKVYGAGRRRALLYVRDAADLVSKVTDLNVRGFMPLNAAGDEVDIGDLARRLCALAGRGSVETAAMPRHIEAIDTGEARICDETLTRLVGPIARTPLEPSLAATVAYFREQLS